MSRKMRFLSERKNGDYRYVRDYPTKLLRATLSQSYLMVGAFTLRTLKARFSRTSCLRVLSTVSFLYQCMTQLRYLQITLVGRVKRCVINGISRWTCQGQLESALTYPLEYMKPFRNAYGERMTEAQEQQLERRLTKLCQRLSLFTYRIKQFRCSSTKRIKAMPLEFGKCVINFCVHPLSTKGTTSLDCFGACLRFEFIKVCRCES